MQHPRLPLPPLQAENSRLRVEAQVLLMRQQKLEEIADFFGVCLV